MMISDRHNPFRSPETSLLNRLHGPLATIMLIITMGGLIVTGTAAYVIVRKDVDANMAETARVARENTENRQDINRLDNALTRLETELRNLNVLLDRLDSSINRLPQRR